MRPEKQPGLTRPDLERLLSESLNGLEASRLTGRADWCESYQKRVWWLQDRLERINGTARADHAAT